MSLRRTLVHQFVFVYVFCLVLCSLLFPPRESVHFPEFGENDFLEYWTASALLDQAADPYDPTLVLEVERSQGWTPDKPLMMWNPPWTVTLLKPFLLLPFDIAARCFLLLNIGAIVLSLFLLLKVFHFSELGRIAAVAFSLLSPSLFLLLLKGQITAIPFLGLSSFIYYAYRSKFLAAGAALSLLSVKPHLGYLLFIPIAYWVIRERRIKVITGFLAASLALVLTTYLVHPSSLLFWWNRSRHESSSLLVPVEQWATSTLATPLRFLSIELGLGSSSWLLVWIPLSTAVLIAYLFVRRSSSVASWKEHFLWLTPLSLFTAPFGWIFDGVFLMISDLAMLDALRRYPRDRSMKSLFGAVILLKVSAIAGWAIYAPKLHTYWIYYAGYCLIAIGFAIALRWADRNSKNFVNVKN